MAERTPNPVFEVVPEDILQVKIADLGNACWTVGLIDSSSSSYLSFPLFLVSTFY
jgi:hypothetical protein